MQLLWPRLDREVADRPGRAHPDAEALPAPAGQPWELLGHRDRQSGREEHQQVEEPLVQRTGPPASSSCGSAIVGSGQTQSRQSIFFLSASWLGCLTRKQDRQTNSPGCLGSTRSTPSPVRSSGSGVSSSSSTSSTTRRSFRMVSRLASTSSSSGSSSSSSSVSSPALAGGLGVRLGTLRRLVGVLVLVGDDAASSSSSGRPGGRPRQSGRRRPPARRGPPRSARRVLRLRRVLVPSRSFGGELGGSIDGWRSCPVQPLPVPQRPAGARQPVSPSGPGQPTRHAGYSRGDGSWLRLPRGPVAKRRGPVGPPGRVQAVGPRGLWHHSPATSGASTAGLGEMFSTRPPGPPSASHSIPPSSATHRRNRGPLVGATGTGRTIGHATPVARQM